MKLLGIQHYSLVVSDSDRSIHFYTNVLGMRKIPHPDQFAHVVWLEAAGTEIHLIPHQQDYSELTAPQSLDAIRDGEATHLAFAINSIAAAIKQLEATATEIVCGPRPRGDGVEQLYIRDPDGYLIELFAWG